MQEAESAVLPLVTGKFMVKSGGKLFEINLSFNLASIGVDTFEIKEVVKRDKSELIPNDEQSMPDSPPANWKLYRLTITLPELSLCTIFQPALR